MNISVKELKEKESSKVEEISWNISKQRKAGGPGVAWAVRGRLWSLREPRPPACRAEKEACSKGGAARLR